MCAECKLFTSTSKPDCSINKVKSVWRDGDGIRASTGVNCLWLPAGHRRRWCCYCCRGQNRLPPHPTSKDDPASASEQAMVPPMFCVLTRLIEFPSEAEQKKGWEWFWYETCKGCNSGRMRRSGSPSLCFPPEGIHSSPATPQKAVLTLWLRSGSNLCFFVFWHTESSEIN